MKQYKVTSLNGNPSGNKFRYCGLNIGDIVSEEEVVRYLRICGRLDWAKTFDWNRTVECFNNQFNTQIEEVAEDMNNVFTKDMLKTGMVVETKNSKRYLVIDDIAIGKKGYHKLDCFDNNLLLENKTFNSDDEFDIMIVYSHSGQYGFGILEAFNDEELTTIWQRQEKSKAQLEIEKMKAEKAKYDKQFEKRLSELESKL